MSDPYLDPATRGWIVNMARANFWRVASWYDLEDLVQDGYLCYYKCWNRYTFLTCKNHPLPDDKKRFMALVKAAFTNHITNLANRRTAGPEIALSQVTDEEMNQDALSAMLPAEPEGQSLRCLLNNAPQELISLVELLSAEGRDTVQYLRTRLRRQAVGGAERVRRGRRRLRETTNEHYCRRLGLDPQVTKLREIISAHLGIAEDAEEQLT